MKQLIFNVLCLLSLAECQMLFSYTLDIDELEKNAKTEIEMYTYPKREWVVPKFTSDGSRIYDVLIIGGGQTGTALALSLYKENVFNILVVESAKKDCEGPWLSHARMEHLRTPKNLTGPDCGLASLTVKQWYTAAYGQHEWLSLNYIPKSAWAHYLQWLHKIINPPILHNTRVNTIEWNDCENCFSINASQKGDNKLVFARKIVLATGITGSGTWHIPSVIKNNLPQNAYTQAAQEIDFTAFDSKRVAIIGAGPNALDCALLLAKHNAQVHLMIRQPKFATANLDEWTHFCGLLHHYRHLSVNDKLRFLNALWCFGSPVMPESIEQIKAYSNVSFHFNSPIVNACMEEQKPILSTPTEEFSFDHVFVACGVETNLVEKKEFSTFCDKIELWGDALGEYDESNEILRSPFLSPSYQLQEKSPGTAPYLKSVFCMTGSAYPSNGDGGGGSIMGLKYALHECVNEITRQLFLEDFDDLLKDFELFTNSLIQL